MVMVTQLRWYQPWRTTRPPTATTAEARNELQHTHTHYRAVCTLGPALAAKVRCSSSRSANACREGYLHHHDVVLLSCQVRPCVDRCDLEMPADVRVTDIWLVMTMNTSASSQKRCHAFEPEVNE